MLPKGDLMCVLCGELITSVHWSEGVREEDKEIVVGEKQRERVRQRLQMVCNSKIGTLPSLSLATKRGEAKSSIT